MIELSADGLGVETVELPPFKLVSIRWRDACMDESTILPIDEILTNPLSLVHTVGFLLAEENPSFFSVVFSLNKLSGTWMCDKIMHIPKSCVIHISFLAETQA